jgi:hypothetical protein
MASDVTTIQEISGGHLQDTYRHYPTHQLKALRSHMDI